MAYFQICILTYLCVTDIFAAVLQPIQTVYDQQQTDVLTITDSQIFLPNNLTVLSSDPSAGSNDIKARCSSRNFGSNLDYNSCRRAVDSVIGGDTIYSFAQRSAQPGTDVKLPYWWLSRK